MIKCKYDYITMFNPRQTKLTAENLAVNGIDDIVITYRSLTYLYVYLSIKQGKNFISMTCVNSNCSTLFINEINCDKRFLDIIILSNGFTNAILTDYLYELSEGTEQLSDNLYLYTPKDTFVYTDLKVEPTYSECITIDGLPYPISYHNFGAKIDIFYKYSLIQNYERHEFYDLENYIKNNKGSKLFLIHFNSRSNELKKYFYIPKSFTALRTDSHLSIFVQKEEK